MPDLMQTDELTQRVLRIIAETQRKDPAQVTIDSSFEELGIDSMDGVNIVFALENEFNINVPDEEVKNIRSVRDMVEGVIRLVNEQPRARPMAARRGVSASRVLMRRVVVTGIGVICGLGRNRDEFEAGVARRPLRYRADHQYRMSRPPVPQRRRSQVLQRQRSFLAQGSGHDRPLRAVRRGGGA